MISKTSLWIQRTYLYALNIPHALIWWLSKTSIRSAGNTSNRLVLSSCCLRTRAFGIKIASNVAHISPIHILIPLNRLFLAYWRRWEGNKTFKHQEYVVYGYSLEVWFLQVFPGQVTLILTFKIYFKR